MLTCGIDPRNDAKRCVEEREGEVHGHHAAQLGPVRRIKVLPLNSVDEQRSSETSSRHQKRFDPTNSVKQCEANRTPDDGQGARDADDEKRLARRYTEDVVDAGTVVVDYIDARQGTKRLYTTAEEKSFAPGWLCNDRLPADVAQCAVGDDDIADFTELELNRLVGNPAAKLLERGHSFLVAILLHEPSRRLLKEENASDENQARNILKCEREAPWDHVSFGVEKWTRYLQENCVLLNEHP